MNGRQFDALSKSLATPRTRRATLKVLAGVAVGGLTALWGTKAAPTRAQGNSDAAHFCQALPPGPGRGQCVSDAAHGAGLFAQCQGDTSRLCPSGGSVSCCAAGQPCVNGTCACGGIGQPCCSGSTCNAGFVCYTPPIVGESGGGCIACGGIGQPCCSGSTCSSLYAGCGNGTCVDCRLSGAGGNCVPSCGGSGQPCCSGNSCTASNSTCQSGTCITDSAPCTTNTDCLPGVGCPANATSGFCHLIHTQGFCVCGFPS